METDYKRIFYETIAWKAYPEKGQNLKKAGLPLRKLEREFPYLLGGGRKRIKKLQVYFAVLPEYAGKKLFKGNPRNWKIKCARNLFNDAWERAYTSLGCTELILTMPYESSEESAAARLLALSPVTELPIELWAVRLYQARPFDSLCILLPEDAGKKEAERIKELLEPYLPRMRRVFFKGKKSAVSELLAGYLYEDFGIVMTETPKVLPDVPALDFCMQADDNGRKSLFISREEILKFLDITVKNGYNTKVN